MTTIIIIQYHYYYYYYNFSASLLGWLIVYALNLSRSFRELRNLHFPKCVQAVHSSETSAKLTILHDVITSVI